MRRWLTLLLLVLMPLQFSWAAAAVYCQHEVQQPGGPDVRHIGHHVHAHEDGTGTSAKPADAQPSADKSQGDKAQAGKLTPDNDCGYCHLSGAKPVTMAAPSLQAAGAEALPRPVAPVFSSRPADHPDRPNWRIA